MIRKKCNVVMLSTEKSGNLYLWDERLYYTPNPLNIDPKAAGYNKKGVQFQHLYFTLPSVQEDSVNGEEIKAGDWIIHSPIAAAPYLTQNVWKRGVLLPNCQKIIATTNSELWDRSVELSIVKGSKFYNMNRTGIHKIPTDFIEVFVKEQGNIKSVLVEYEEYDGFSTQGEPNTYIQYKRVVVNNNGSVKVYPVEDRKYSREDIKKMFYSYIDGDAVHTYSSIGEALELFDKWFESNYPI